MTFSSKPINRGGGHRGGVEMGDTGCFSLGETKVAATLLESSSTHIKSKSRQCVAPLM